MSEVFRSQRSIDQELREAALRDAEETRATRIKAVDYILDRFLSGKLDIDGMAEVLVVTGLIENE